MATVPDIAEQVSRIATITKKAEQAIEPKLKAVERIIQSIKEGLAAGVDTIDTAQATEWSLALSLANIDITPSREAFSLTSALWSLEAKRLAAKNIIDKDAKEKKCDKENENIITLNEYGVHQAVVDYMSTRLTKTKGDITEILNVLKRIIDARNKETLRE